MTRVKSLMMGCKKGQDGIIWHRDHRAKKNRRPYTHRGILVYEEKLRRMEDKEVRKHMKKIIHA